MRPWIVLDRIETHDGVLELRRRDAADFVIALEGLILMSSRASRSEARLGALVAARLPRSPRPRLLIGGLGMGITLRAALDALPAAAEVVVAELNPIVVEWCRGPLGALTRSAVTDSRVRVALGDVAEHIRSAATGAAERFDGIALDLYEGLRPAAGKAADQFYGTAALKRARAALSRSGVFGRWSEQPDRAFEQRLRAAGFTVHSERVGQPERRHAVCLGIAQPRGARPGETEADRVIR